MSPKKTAKKNRSSLNQLLFPFVSEKPHPTAPPAVSPVEKPPKISSRGISGGTGVRIGPGGQLEFTMRPKTKNKKWVLSSTGKRIEWAKKIARSIVQNYSTHPFVRNHPELLHFCYRFLSNPSAKTSQEMNEKISTLFHAMREIKKKNDPHQRLMDFARKTKFPPYPEELPF